MSAMYETHEGKLVLVSLLFLDHFHLHVLVVVLLDVVPRATPQLSRPSYVCVHSLTMARPCSDTLQHSLPAANVLSPG